MVEKNQSEDAVRNIFKKGTMPTKEEYTKLWVKIINEMEREKSVNQNTE